MTVREIDIASSKVQAPVPAPQSTALESIGFSPLRTLERFADEVTRLFDDFGLGRGWHRPAGPADALTWAPRADITQHKGELVVRVDLPGVKKEDVNVSVTEDTVTIRGERYRELDEARDGVYRSERHDGAFARTISLPPGTGTDQAKASFKDGVLEVRMPTAPGTKGRPVEITG